MIDACVSAQRAVTSAVVPSTTETAIPSLSKSMRDVSPGALSRFATIVVSEWW